VELRTGRTLPAAHGIQLGNDGAALTCCGANLNAHINPMRGVYIRVVVADDHSVVRGIVRSVLQQHPHFEVVGEAENGAEAIEEVKRARPDVVVLNVSMPQVNGFQAAREIKKQVPETAIVILSSHADRYFVEEAKRVGVRGYVPKSKIGQALVGPIEAAVNRDDFMILD
jgi:DNA-binding NarL/FixJ family response regulator